MEASGFSPWPALASSFLDRYGAPSFSPGAVDLAEQWVHSSAARMSGVPGAWRASVLNGSIYVRMLHVKRHWRERSSVLRLLLLAQNAYRLPDVDFVYIHCDQDVAPMLGFPPCKKVDASQPDCGARVPFLTNSFEERGNKSSFPAPEFSWVGWGKQPSWCELSDQIQQTAVGLPWEKRIDQLYFSGSLSNGWWRQRLRSVYAAHRAANGTLLHVRDVHSTFSDISHGAAVRTNASARREVHRDRSVPMTDACRYRYLLSIPGFGYSNRLRSLLACGSVVIHVRSPWNEFFLPLLRPDVHFVVVNRVEGVLPALLELRKDEARARRIAHAGGHFATHTINFDGVLRYFHTLLSQYAARMTSRVTLRPGYTLLRDEADLMQLVHQSRCLDGGPRHHVGCCIGADCPNATIRCPSREGDGGWQTLWPPSTAT